MVSSQEDQEIKKTTLEAWSHFLLLSTLVVAIRTGAIYMFRTKYIVLGSCPFEADENLPKELACNS